MALPDARNRQDRLLTVNINSEIDLPNDLPGATIKPLFLDRENGVCVLYGTFQPGIVLPTHFQTRTAHFFTTKGRWRYAETPKMCKPPEAISMSSAGRSTLSWSPPMLPKAS